LTEMGLDIDEEADDDMRVSLTQRAVIRAVLDQGALRAPSTALSKDITSTVAKMAAKARARANKGKPVRGARAMTGSGRAAVGSAVGEPLCTTPAELLVGLW
jgi:predicted RNA-binding protein with PIN domain